MHCQCSGNRERRVQRNKKRKLEEILSSLIDLIFQYMDLVMCCFFKSTNFLCFCKTWLYNHIKANFSSFVSLNEKYYQDDLKIYLKVSPNCLRLHYV